MHKKAGIFLILLLIASTGVFYVYEQQRAKPTGLIRLHIIANSNTFYDQTLKYRVKDRVVSEMAPVFSQATGIETARQVADANLETIHSIAEEEIRLRGFDYPVQVVRGDYYFPAKKYTIQEENRMASLTLPPGHYEAVRVIIGSGDGANWWCVLYPPLCFVDLQQAAPPVTLSTASAAQEQRIEKSADSTAKAGLKPKIEYRFKILELFKGAVAQRTK
ncbi:stage II sporulation protein R [Desulfoscipio gibsoniae]